MEQRKDWGTDTVGFIVSGAILTVTVNNEYFTISSENPNFDKAKEALNAKNVDELLEALKPIKVIERAVADIANQTQGAITVEDDGIYYHKMPLHGVVVNRILEFKKNGMPYGPLVAFLENLIMNPSKTVVDELYEWMKAASTPMPITEDGHFLAYKKVKANFHDAYSGKLDYSVGNIVEVPYDSVDADRNRTCSHGLHFCSLGYLPSFGAGNAPNVVIVKINPKDVVAFPRDSRTSKGRCARMEVIGIHKGTDHQEAWNGRGYVDTAKEYPKPEAPTAPVAPVDTTTKRVFPSREKAQEYARTYNGRFKDEGYAYQLNKSKRWVVYGGTEAAPNATHATAAYTYFATREQAQIHAKATGKSWKDFGTSSNIGYRWAVVN